MGAPGALQEPKKLVHARVQFPSRKTPTWFSSTIWHGVAQIGPDGAVTAVRVIRPIKPRPPWPEWEEAIPAAIRKWRFEPTCKDGHPVSTEISVSVEIYI
jgi:hypothetical protein